MLDSTYVRWVGAWIDVCVLLWVTIVLMTAMGVFMISWLRHRGRPDYSVPAPCADGSGTNTEPADPAQDADDAHAGAAVVPAAPGREP